MLSEGKDINIKEIMDGWILQMGYPVVTITKNEGPEDTVTVSQEHFLYDTDAKIHHPEFINKRYSSAFRATLIDTTSGDLYPSDDLWTPLVCLSGGMDLSDANTLA